MAYIGIMKPNPLWLNWSGGKDCTMALWLLSQDPAFRVARLVTTLSQAHRRVSMHGVREALLDRQAESLGIPLKKIWLPEHAGMEQYSQVMVTAVGELLEEGIALAAFGDIFLEDLRLWRESQLSGQGVKALFPVWGRNSGELAREFIAAGFRAIVVCVNHRWLDPGFAGKPFGPEFLDGLPPGVDPCGENGEFHTFVYDGPLFSNPIAFRQTEIVEREYPAPGGDQQEANSRFRFTFQDLEPA